MTTAASQSKLDSVELNSNQTQAQLDRLERHEWWRWSIAFVVMLALTFGLFALSMSVRGGLNWTEQAQLNIVLRGLFALVLLFDIFVVYQQVLITRLRRDLATQLRVVTTLEALKKVDGEANRPQNERRHLRRLGVDRRVRVNSVHEGKATCVHGRIRDISENGMGAVIPCALALNQQVTLEFSMEEGREDTVSATVRHRRGFCLHRAFTAGGHRSNYGDNSSRECLTVAGLRKPLAERSVLYSVRIIYSRRLAAAKYRVNRLPLPIHRGGRQPSLGCGMVLQMLASFSLLIPQSENNGGVGQLLWTTSNEYPSGSNTSAA